MAHYGFFYLNHEDYVRCFFCSVEIYQWADGDDVLMNHMNFSPNCPLLKNPSMTSNISTTTLVIPDIDINAYNEILYNIKEMTIKPESEGQEVRGLLEFTKINYKHPNFAKFSQRVQSFSDWPSSLHPDITSFAQFGFFYTNIGDKVSCFYCGVTLDEWSKQSNIKLRHLMASSECTYIKACNYSEKMSRNRRCIVCMNQNYNVVLISCFHICCCLTCAFELENCPCCRKKIEKIIKVSF